MNERAKKSGTHPNRDRRRRPNRRQRTLRAINIAAEMNVTKPSVSVELGKLQDLGLITVEQEKMIRFTPEGRALAELTYAKHCYFREKLLAVGVDPETAEKEACALEHAISSHTFELIRTKDPLNAE